MADAGVARLSSSLIGAYAMRGVAWWPLGAVAAIAGVLVTGPAVDPAKPASPCVAADAPAQPRRGGAIVLVGIALLPIWRPIDPGLDAPAGVVGNAPPGITAALRDMARPGDRLLQPAAVGLVVRVRAARPARRHRLADRALPAGGLGRPTRTSSPAATAGRRSSTRWGVSIVVVPRKDEAFADRLAAAGWRSVYSDDDGVDRRRSDSMTDCPVPAASGPSGR